MNRVRILAIANACCLLVQILASYGSQAGLWGPETVGGVSDRYPSLFTPDGLTFAIWGLIYFLLLLLCIRHLLAAFRFPLEQETNQETSRMGLFFSINNLLAAAWVVAWCRLQIGLSLILIGGQLLTLIIIHLRLNIHSPERSLGSNLLTQVPLSVYFGWITVAVIANTSVYLVSVHWEGAGIDLQPATWTLGAMALAVMVNIVVIFARRNVAFGLVLIWALWGIWRRQQGGPHELLPGMARGCMLVIAMACLIQLTGNLWTKYRMKKPRLSNGEPGPE